MVKYRKWIMGAAALAALQSSAALAEKMTNADVLMLLDAGIPAEAVVAKIQSSEPDFAVDSADLIDLKNKGVPAPVLTAMIVADGKVNNAAPALSKTSADPMAPHYPGAYLMQSDVAQPQMVFMDSIMSSQVKTGGFLGYVLTSGIAKMSFVAVFPSATAQYKTSSAQPEFYFFFDSSNASVGEQPVGAFATGFNQVIASPSDLYLIRFKVKKGNREAKFGSFNIGGAKMGVMDKDRIPFTYSEVRQGVYKVTPNAPLEPGEYGFMYSIATGGGTGAAAGGSSSARVFGFSVQ